MRMTMGWSMKASAVALLLTATSCTTARPRPADGPPLPVAATLGADSAWRCGSGIMVRLGLATPSHRIYESNHIEVLIGTGENATRVSPEYLLLTTHGTWGFPNNGIFPTPSTGAIPISIFIRDTISNDREAYLRPAAHITLDVPLKPTWIWYLSIDIKPRSLPTDYLFSKPTLRFEKAQLPNGDSLFVHVFGARRCGPLVFR